MKDVILNLFSIKKLKEDVDDSKLITFNSVN